MKELILQMEKEINKAKAKLREFNSRKFIALNGITSEQVEMSIGHGKEWFGEIGEFGKWLEANSKKPWAEWNGRIYRSADLIGGLMPDMPGKTDHLPSFLPRSPGAETAAIG